MCVSPRSTRPACHSCASHRSYRPPPRSGHLWQGHRGCRYGYEPTGGHQDHSRHSQVPRRQQDRGTGTAEAEGAGPHQQAVRTVSGLTPFRALTESPYPVISKCIHLLHWFDHRNHICLVSELLGMCVYDFLKENEFAPFPRQHIQSFARQLLGSVACMWLSRFLPVIATDRLYSPS